MEERKLVCIECPRGCDLVVRSEGNQIDVSGNFCPRGKKYAQAEVVCPRRVLTSTVRATFGMIPVRTNKEVKKSEMMKWMAKIRALRIDRDVEQGEILLADLDGEGTNLIAAAAYRNQEADNVAF